MQFKNFSQRVEEVDVDVFRSLAPVKFQPTAGSSFFHENLVQWKVSELVFLGVFVGFQYVICNVHCHLVVVHVHMTSIVACVSYVEFVFMAYRFYLLFQGTSGWELVVLHTPSSMFSKFLV